MYEPDRTGRANTTTTRPPPQTASNACVLGLREARQTAMTPALLAGSTDAIGTVGNRPLRNGSAAERIARMQRARIVLASNPPKEMTRQEINEEISAYRKLKRLATAS
jgi:hypothetical protein